MRISLDNQRTSIQLSPKPYIPSSPKSINYGIFSINRTSSGPSRTGSGLVLGSNATIPSRETWLRSGNVERQTVSTDMLWLPRLIILTSDSVIFSKEGSDVILDKFPLQNIVYVGKVPQHNPLNNSISTFILAFFFVVRLIELRMLFLAAYSSRVCSLVEKLEAVAGKNLRIISVHVYQQFLSIQMYPLKCLISLFMDYLLF